MCFTHVKTIEIVFKAMQIKVSIFMWLVRNPYILLGKGLGFFCHLEVVCLLEWSSEDSRKVRTIA